MFVELPIIALSWMSSCKEIEVGEFDVIMTLRFLGICLFILLFVLFQDFVVIIHSLMHETYGMQYKFFLFCFATWLLYVIKSTTYCLIEWISSIMIGIYTHILYSYISRELLSYCLLPFCTTTWVDLVSLLFLEGGGNQ